MWAFLAGLGIVSQTLPTVENPILFLNYLALLMFGALASLRNEMFHAAVATVVLGLYVVLILFAII